MNRSAAHTKLVREILAAVGSLPGVIAGDNPCGLARYPRFDDPTKLFAVPYGWPAGEGSPDLLIAVFGKLVAIECKTGKAVTSPAQKRVLNALREVGVTVIEARCVDDVSRVVDEMRRRAA